MITYERTWWICTIQIETRIWIVQIHISIQNITSCEKNCNIRICIKPKYVWYIFLNERTYLFPCFVSFLLHKIAFIRCAMKTFCIIRIRFDSSFNYHQHFKPWKINNHLFLINYWVFRAKLNVNKERSSFTFNVLKQTKTSITTTTTKMIMVITTKSVRVWMYTMLVAWKIIETVKIQTTAGKCGYPGCSFILNKKYTH